MPAFNLALGPRVMGRAANVIHVLAVEPFGDRVKQSMIARIRNRRLSESASDAKSRFQR
jgi:hypothetical protein